MRRAKNPPCAGCGGPHPFDTSILTARWNAIIRESGLPDYLCFTCIVTAFVKAGESFHAELIGKEHHFVPIEIKVRSNMALDVQALSQENTELRGRLRELEILVEAKEGTINAVVYTVGGMVEGAPTHRINFLQRIEELLEIERREASHRQSLKTAPDEAV